MKCIKCGRNDVQFFDDTSMTCMSCYVPPRVFNSRKIRQVHMAQIGEMIQVSVHHEDKKVDTRQFTTWSDMMAFLVMQYQEFRGKTG